MSKAADNCNWLFKEDWADGSAWLSLSMLSIGYTMIPLTSPFLLHIIGMLVIRILSVLWSGAQWSQALVREGGVTLNWGEWIVEFSGGFDNRKVPGR